MALLNKTLKSIAVYQKPSDSRRDKVPSFSFEAITSYIFQEARHDDEYLAKIVSDHTHTHTKKELFYFLEPN